MRTRQSFAIQALIAILVGNAILLAAIYFLLSDAIRADQIVVLLVAGGVISLLLWLAVSAMGRRYIESDAPIPAARPMAAAAPAPVTPRVTPQEPAVSAEAGAVQMLAILQRQGRLIDFLQEDLRMYDDAQIGAAVRPIHEGCKQALAEHVRLEPIFDEAEGGTVSVQPGFDTRAIRLTGDVVGEPPFRGALRHRGWRVASIDLPKQTSGQNREFIAAPAEVEVGA